ncbi:vegetative cell wall protein gp1-like [Etheostoma cragini]|uniref:vegetative cell wall protein gp1-like n=1 Tax=Etheostoma cragini TaxID=417921 RepID=UPI00155EC09D|nr:vegetative cell wall protein gp1-like [Etheostoma cragini]
MTRGPAGERRPPFFQSPKTGLTPWAAESRRQPSNPPQADHCPTPSTLPAPRHQALSEDPARTAPPRPPPTPPSPAKGMITAPARPAQTTLLPSASSSVGPGCSSHTQEAVTTDT